MRCGTDLSRAIASRAFSACDGIPRKRRRLSPKGGIHNISGQRRLSKSRIRQTQDRRYLCLASALTLSSRRRLSLNLIIEANSAARADLIARPLPRRKSGARLARGRFESLTWSL
jgi:hypothetical protein